MEGLLESVASVLGKAIGSLIHGIDDQKSCSSECTPTWDVSCYIEHFCIVSLLRLGLMLIVLYVVFLYIYLIYKLKFFHCIFCCIFKTAWGCCKACFGCCHCLFHEISSTKRSPRRTRMSHFESFNLRHEHIVDEPSLVSRSRTRRHHKRHHSIMKSLQPRSHRVHVGIHGGRGYRRSMKGYPIVDGPHRGVRVMRTTRFARKGSGSLSSRRHK